MVAGTDSARGWAEAGDVAIGRVTAADDGDLGPHTYAYTAWATALRQGWDAPLVERYLGEIRRLRNPDGGWGLPDPFDAYQDGSVNSERTTYTITLARHVGRPLLEGYRAGVVAAPEIQSIIDLLVAAPTVPTTLPGLCVAYSFAAADAQQPCVHNVNVAVAGFLADARAAGFSAPGLDRRVAAILRHELAAYLPEEANWPYMGAGGRRNDMTHLDGTVYALRTLAPQISDQVARRLLQRRDYARWVDPLGQIAILPLYCDQAPRFLEAMWRILEHPEQSPRLLAQTGLHAARIAASCGAR